MEIDKYLRDGTNIGRRFLMPRNLKQVVPNSSSINIIDKENLKNSKLVKRNDIKTLSAKDEIMDISMLSISADESNDKVGYKLPDSSELNSVEFLKQWKSDMGSRRWNNRISVIGELSRLEKRLSDISFDQVTGERYLMENLDYRMDLEISKMPLGRNFLYNTNISPSVRASTIDLLFSTSEALRTDRYTVPMALACLDRYVKTKGSAMQAHEYKYVALSCWFLCCKFDLVYYPSIEDLCELHFDVNPNDLIEVEIDILKTINFYISCPTPIEFLRPLTLLKQREGVSHNIAKFLIEVSMYVYDLAGHPSHMIAAASYCLSMALSFRQNSIEDTWTDLMKIFTGIDVEDIRSIITILGHVIISTDYAVDMTAVGREHATVIEVLNKRQTDIMRLTKC